MLVFNSIEIHNFYSIESLKFTFRNGIHKLSGSNGVGKTSISSAITQCLYNKNPKSNSTIDSTYNYVTGKAYKIELRFSKEGISYIVCNDRTTNNITILQEGKEIRSKGIKAQLNNIQKIIGVDYETFLSITYLNQNSISSVFDLTDSNNLVNKFFDIDLIKYIDKQLKLERREGRKHLAFLEAQNKDNLKTIVALEKYVAEDTVVYEQQKRDKLHTLNELTSGNTSLRIKSLESVLTKAKEVQHELHEPLLLLKGEYEAYKKQLEQLSTGVCPVCGNKVSSIQNELDRSLGATKEALQEATNVYKEQVSKVEGIQTKYSGLLTSYETEVSSIRKGISLLVNKINIIEEKNNHIAKIQKDKEVIISKQQALSLVIETKSNELLFIEGALGVISSGSITKQYVSTFITVLNSKLNGLISNLDLPLCVEVQENNSDINYIITNNGEPTLYETLSSGERTRVSLVVLLSIIETLEVLTSVQVSTMIFDELLSVLDEEGVALFQQQLNSYRSQRCVFVVIHHDEIEDDYFDSIFKVYKQNNLTKLEVVV